MIPARENKARLLCCVALIVPLGIGACSTTPVAVCPPLKDYPESFSNQLANEMEAMPADSATVQAIGDYIELRDVLRTCQ